MDLAHLGFSLGKKWAKEQNRPLKQLLRKGMVIKEASVQITVILGVSGEIESVGCVCMCTHICMYVYIRACVYERENERLILRNWLKWLSGLACFKPIE